MQYITMGVIALVIVAAFIRIWTPKDSDGSHHE